MKNTLLAALLCLVLLLPVGANAATPDFAVANGHFFSQTGSGDGALGFTVIDDGEARFWSEFQRLGGIEGVGYPVSHRFQWDGFVVQAMQKGVLQWRPEVGKAYFVNVFDQLSLAGKDDWLLRERSTPDPLGPEFDAGKGWEEVVSERRALLDANPAIKARYYAAADPMNFYGLPTTRVEDNGNHYVIRLQRAVIQQWKEAVPWAAAGQVTVANGGAVGLEAAMYPAEAVKPAAAPQRAAPPSSRGGARPSGDPAETALELVDYYRGLAGAPPLVLHDALNRATANHVRYYELNDGDPSLAGMGLHQEKVGRPGFTGVTMGDRARAAGYTASYSVDENMGLVRDARRMVEWSIDTVNHRWNMLHPSAVHFGYALGTERAVDVMNMGFSATRPAVDLPTAFPGPGQTGVPTSSNIYETPDPAPGVPRPLGYPITVSFHVKDSVQFTDWSLTGADGVPVQIFTTQRSWIKSLALIPARPLRSGETYTASVGGTVNGAPFSKVWSFTTR